MKIEVDEQPIITTQTTYQIVELEINKKRKVSVSRYVAVDENIGVTADELEIVDDDGDEELTDEEVAEIKDFCEDKVKWN